MFTNRIIGLRNYGLSMSRRFQSNISTTGSATKSTFNNKYNFNTNPPPIHEYWYVRNSSVLIACIPLYLIVGYAAKYAADDIDSFNGLLGFYDKSDSTKELQFGEPQVAKK